jgi:large subunit ribosomal protein L19
MNQLESVEHSQAKAGIPEFRVGDTVAVHVNIREGDKERIQVFEGIVIRKRRGGQSATFTVRKISYGVGVERIFPLHAPAVEKIDVVSRGQVRQSRLYYLRDLKGKAARIREKKAPSTTPDAS